MKTISLTILLLLALVFCLDCQAQIGVNTFNIASDVNLDVDGSIRLRQLTNTRVNNTELVADNNGNIAATILGTNTFIETDFHFVKSTNSIKTTTAHSISTNPLDLDLSITITIPPQTEVMLYLEYNVPVIPIITSLTTSAPSGKQLYAEELGIALFKSSTGLNIAETALPGLTRKQTPYLNNNDGNNTISNPGGFRGIYDNSMQMQASGIDKIKNTKNIPETITYTLKGLVSNIYTTQNPSFYFGMSPKEILNDWRDSGTGIFTIDVYEKKISKE